MDIRITLYLLITFSILGNINAVPNRSPERSDLTLATDIKWFFGGIANFARTVERVLPEVKVDIKNKTLSENALLIGLRHVLQGVREISTTFEQSLKTDHIKLLQQFKNATEFVNDTISVLKMWLRQLRALVVHLYTLYNQYIPEVLFGKCLGNYLVSTYPDRSYYEYPFILLAEIYESVLATAIPDSEQLEDVTQLYIDDDLNMAQNEISHTDTENSYGSEYHSSKFPSNPVEKSRSRPAVEVEAPISESFFDFSTVLGDDKASIIKDAAQQKSWKICMKLYTAESISRSLKSYFLS